ncbi:hypothetical protein [Marinobacter sp. CHS3-4]|uniref:hypothetical protein n=1 Tax=Marinobacter sp. CHS3-4 TaxID=3045174 RepID=UPI0024B4ADC5|nr:hypothetical protein [Marinobacter sp. CHS3-4]MDI9243997.1 hypothetical protein [Marinobacter sp. CHS3-4]
MLTDQAVTKTDENDLPPPVVQEDDLTSGGSTAQPCQDARYATAIYVFGQRSFWLLPEQLLEKIETSADRLKAAVSKATAQERFKALEAAGLKDMFLPASPYSFLPPEQQKEWQKLSKDIAEARARLEDLRREFDKYKEEHLEKVGQIQTIPDDEKRASKEREALTQLEEAVGTFGRNRNECFEAIQSKKSRLEDLEDEGFSAAETAGYLVENGELFLPAKKDIMALMEEYVEAREDFEDDEFDSQQNLEAFVSQLRLNEELLDYEFSQPKVNWSKLEPYLDAAAQLTGRMRNYLLSVEGLAHAGFATPEYSLGASKDSLQKGVLALSDFKKLEYEKQSLKEQQQQRFEIWWDSIGGKGPIPSGELEQFQRDINTCETRQKAVHTSAKDAAGALVPPKMFVWNPAEYDYPSVRALVRPGMPLREFCRPGAETVQHFSLLHIAGAKDYFGTPEEPDSPFDVAMAIKAAQVPGNDKALEKLLIGLGAKPYPLQNDWFDENGVFQPEHFFESIEPDAVADLQSEADRAAWGDYLKNLLFNAKVAQSLPRFNETYSGQFMRLVLSGVGNGETDGISVDVLRVESNVTGPDERPQHSAEERLKDINKVERKTQVQRQKTLHDNSDPQKKTDEDTDAISGTLGKVDLQLKATFWEGRTDLFSIQLPKPEDARDIVIQYDTTEGDQALKLGKFYCQLDAQCWGTVGANLLLSRELEVRATDKGQLQISGVDFKTREAVGAQFEASAAATMGAMVNGELYWSLPKDFRDDENARQLNGNLPEWFNLGRVSAEAEGGIGPAASYDFMLGLHKGRLVVRLKGKAIAAIGIGGGIQCELALNAVPIFMRLLQQELHRNGYRHLVWIDTDAFDYMSLLIQIHLSTALSFAFLTGLAYDKLEEMGRNWDRGERAGEISLRIVRAVDIYNGDAEATDDEPLVTYDEYQDWFQGLQPEAIGPMLHTLVAEPVAIEGEKGREPKSRVQVLKLQQRSILQCLKWMTARDWECGPGWTSEDYVAPESYRGASPNRIQRQFEEALTRMNTQGVKEKDDGLGWDDFEEWVSLSAPSTSDCKQAAKANLKRLDEFMARSVITPEDARIHKAYESIRRKLSRHLLDQV